jgi:hypothetical protein
MDQSSDDERHGGFIAFLPGIISAINSNKAHKKRVLADKQLKASYLTKYKGTAQEGMSFSEQQEYEQYEAAANEQVRTTKLQDNALKTAWAKVGANPDGSPLAKEGETQEEK